MLLDIVIEIIIIGIIFLCGFLGYRTGVVSMALTPVRKILQVGSSIMLCLPLSELIRPWIVIPAMTDRLSLGLLTPISRAISVALAFVVLMVICGIVLSAVRSILTAIFSIGLLGKINHTLGMIFALMLGVLISFAFCLIFDKISSASGYDFSGGRIFHLFISINLFK